MHRQTPRLTTAVLAALALAACADSHTLSPTAPAAGPVMAKGGNGNGNGYAYKDLIAGPASSIANVPPSPYAGNTSGAGTADCSSYGNAMAVKVEDNFNRTVAGYAFRVDGGTVSFSRSSPGYAITAVLVKGGPAYDAFDYTTRNGTALNSGTTLGVTADGGLTAPKVGNGKNTPDVSHYVVCYVRNIRVSKRLVAVKASDGHGGMIADPSYHAGGPVVIPQGETRWLQFEIRYEQAPGSTGTLTEIVPDLCRSAGFSCLSPDFTTSDPNSAKFTVTGSGTKTITLDVTSKGCDSGTLTNKAMFDVPPLWVSDEASVTIVGQCVQKRLVNVYSGVGSDGKMIADATYVPATPSSVAKVTIPQGETRWLEYEISYTLGGNGSGSLLENLRSACAALNAQYNGGYTCTSAGFEGRGGLSTTLSGTGTIRIMIDIKNDHACHDRDFVNTATLTRSGSGGPATTATAPAVMIWARDC